MGFMRKLELVFACGVVAFVAVPRASATAELTLTDGTNVVNVFATSCGVGCESASYTGTVGNWGTVTITLAQGLSGSTQTPIMDLSVDAKRTASTSGETLTIEYSDNSFTPAASGWNSSIGGTISTAGGTATSNLYYGGSTLFGKTTLIGSMPTFTNTCGAMCSGFSGSTSGYLAGLSVNPYALTQVATLSFGANSGLTSFDWQVDAIPEPAGVLLLGTAILFTASAIRRKIAAGKRA